MVFFPFFVDSSLAFGLQYDIGSCGAFFNRILHFSNSKCKAAVMSIFELIF